MTGKERGAVPWRSRETARAYLARVGRAPMKEEALMANMVRTNDAAVRSRECAPPLPWGRQRGPAISHQTWGSPAPGSNYLARWVVMKGGRFCSFTSVRARQTDGRAGGPASPESAGGFHRGASAFSSLLGASNTPSCGWLARRRAVLPRIPRSPITTASPRRPTGRAS